MPLSAVPTQKESTTPSFPPTPPVAALPTQEVPNFGTKASTLAPLAADTFTKSTPAPAFGNTADAKQSSKPKIRMLETFVVRRLTNNLDDVLRDPKDWQRYMDGSQPFLKTLKSRYEHLPYAMRDSVIGPHAMSYNIRNRVQRGMDSGIIYKEEELSDILFFLYEANRRAEQGDKRFEHYPRLDLKLPKELTEKLDLMVASKPMPADHQFYDEVSEFLDELSVSGKRKQQVNDLLVNSDIINGKTLDQVARLSDLPDLNEKDLYQYNYLKMSMRDALWNELPGQANYDYRKLITKPFERLLAAEFFTQKTPIESAVTGVQNALWSKLITPVDQVPAPSKN